MKLLQDKVCLVTGASRGIGRAIAQCMAEQGAAVAFTYLSSPEKAKDLENELAANGVKVKGYQSDASDFSAAEKLISDVLADFGRIDVVVNNAGITRDNLLMRMSEDSFNEVIKTNLNSVFNITKAVQRPMLKERKGSIINMTSVVGGFIETEMTDVLNQDVVNQWREAIPMKRGGTPKDVADLVVFLASDMSGYITGQVIHVNGGMLT